MILGDISVSSYRGIDINGGTVGIAFIGTMCSENLAVGVTQDFGTIEATGATAAHEMGHIFNMEHDDNSKQIHSLLSVSKVVIFDSEHFLLSIRIK